MSLRTLWVWWSQCWTRPLNALSLSSGSWEGEGGREGGREGWREGDNCKWTQTQLRERENRERERRENEREKGEMC